MTARLRRHKGMIIIAIIVVLVLFGWLYRELHPTIVFHSPQESKYLGKVSGMHIPADTRSAFPVISVHSPVSIQYRWQS